MGKIKTKGIFLIAFGKRGYSFAAYNLALSIKHYNPTIKIGILHDSSLIKNISNLSVFDHLIQVDDSEIYNNGKIDPAKIKCNFYDKLPFDENLFLDVDAIALKDLQPLIDTLSEKDGYFLTQVFGKGGKADKIEYSIWAENNDIWEFFNLGDDSVLTAIQSSFCYIKKGKEAKAFFNAVNANYKKGFPVEKAKLWGGTIADELIYSGTIAQFGFDAASNLTPIFFGSHYDSRSYSEIENDHFIMSLFGNGRGKTLTKLRYIERYDKLMLAICQAKGVSHIYKSNYIMADKHLNNK